MRVVVQRVSEARVTVAGEVIGEIGSGLLVLLGVQTGDTDDEARWLAEKVVGLRIFEDANGKMNRSLHDLVADRPDRVDVSSLLVISQFTLIASTRKGTRPSFNDAARPDHAIPLYEAFLGYAATALRRPVATGRFGATMEVSLVNHGPVTLVIDSRARE
jgi:D-tyrosyl-tRNA(Tyr) deacylase